RRGLVDHMPACFSSDTSPTDLYPLSLHDALPIWTPYGARIPASSTISYRSAPKYNGSPEFLSRASRRLFVAPLARLADLPCSPGDRKSTRLNSSHVKISYAVFCLKKKKNNTAPDC